MKSVAIIAEYNPYHNGHQYHAEMARAKSHADIVIAIMSGQFTQRGEPAIFSKFARAESALNGCDLVVELPQFYAMSYADDFAYGGVKTAQILRADALAFGAECDDLDLLKAEANRVREADIKSGRSYAVMMGDETFSQPNNILAMQYIKAADPMLDLIPIKRIQNHYHDTELTGRIASATAIRKAISAGHDFSESVPASIDTALAVSWEDFFPLLKYKILSHTPEELRNIYMMTEGLENRLKSSIDNSHDFSSYMQTIKTKRYTYTRLQRLLAYTLLNIKEGQPITDIRVLAMNDKGRAYIKGIPHLHTNINKKNASLFAMEIRATQIYNLISGDKRNDFNTPVIYQRTSF
ncbi:nucleotidyltransferase [Macrococcus brunensis]|uniref:tRNA(Met) cytidine acetate ligase n=1 Tax=Macrococcus brunensis TaxID=198483 RepID=A0A4R6BFZ2_9STAP|nr:nucleotidyltransferase family protein [Macrococcus brunensis]TDL98784.1 nucleotidyltransferase [Macrococcus brunensis]ULG72788.1 nucleotidyltransferase family protein [Macrococcus brunensis]